MYFLQIKNKLKIKYKSTVRGKRTITNCKNCNEEFEALDIKLRQGKDKFCCNDCYKDFRQKNKMNPEEIKQSEIIYQKASKYGLSKEDYLLLFINQNNKCLICGCEFAEKNKAFVDHDHNTGKVRGLLCTKCNSLLGFANDDPVILNKAIDYLNTN